MTSSKENDYLKALLEDSSKYSLTERDEKKIKFGGIKEYAYSKITSKKFRRTKLTSDAVDRTRGAISESIDSDKSINVVFFLGGYKLWRIESSPYPDWAEFFNISYLINYVAPIAEAYKPGVKIVYYIHTLVPELHDNLTKEEIDQYVDTFQKMIDEFSKHLPDNIEIEISKDADFYSREEYFEIMENNLEKGKADFDSMPEEKQKAAFEMSKLNVKFDGREDLTKLTESEKEQRILKGAYYEKSLGYLTKPGEYVKSSDKINTFVIGPGAFIGIGSCKTSMTKFWTGFGILENRGDKLLPRILSPKQIEGLKEMNTTEVDVDVLKLPNLDKIVVVDEALDFVRN